MNSGNISDICDKLNFTTNYTRFTTTDIHFINTHIKITIFDTFDETDLSIFVQLLPPPFLQEKVDTKREVHEVMYMDTFGST